MNPPPENTIAAGLLALEIAAQQLRLERQRDLQRTSHGGRTPHPETVIRADRAEYLYQQGRAALDAIRGERRAGTVTYDCGSHGQLTAAEAAKIARCHVSRIKSRAAAGITGDRLVEQEPQP